MIFISEPIAIELMLDVDIFELLPIKMVLFESVLLLYPKIVLLFKFVKDVKSDEDPIIVLNDPLTFDLRDL